MSINANNIIETIISVIYDIFLIVLFLTNLNIKDCNIDNTIIHIKKYLFIEKNPITIIIK